MTEDDLRRDLAPFADPATEVRIDLNSKKTSVRLVRDGTEVTLAINNVSGAIKYDGGSRAATYSNIESLLASELFADLRGFASHQQRILSSIQKEPIIETDFELNGNAVNRATILSRLARSSPKKVKIVVLDGPAGIGKTRFLETLSLEHAQAFTLGQTVAPVLHVSSRGDRLLNLRAVLAKTTQMFRAKFNFDEVPVLVRKGLILLAIDGFDELVDADGYKDAWFALREFIDEIGTSGSLILAGRDTFFDQQGFYDRLEIASTNLDVEQVRIRPVRPSIAIAWLRDRGWSKEDVESSIADDTLKDDSYVLRPYFLAQLANLGGWAGLATSSLRKVLIDRFIARESKLLLGVASLREDIAINALSEIYENVALDMAERQADSVDIDYLTLLCDVAFEDSLSVDDALKLRHKIGSIGLLERDLNNRMRRFPHQEIFHYFLALSIVAEISQNRVPIALRHCVLGTDFLEVFNEEVQHEPSETAQRFLRLLIKSLSREPDGDRLANNSTALVLTSLSKSRNDDKVDELANMETTDACLIGATPSANLSNITIGRLDARGADFSSVTFSDCHVAILSADATTRFGQSLPQIGLVRELRQGEMTTIRDRAEVNSWLTERSIKPLKQGDVADDALPLVKLLDRICRKIIRQFSIREGADDEGGVLLDDPLWPPLRKILTANGRLEEYTQSMGGPPANLIRIRNPKNLLCPPKDDPESAALRRRIIRRARQLWEERGGRP
jgi:hypothetical protein